MTAKHKTKCDRSQLLERILDTVGTIDRNVEDVLERLEAYMDESRYASWQHDSYDNGKDHY